MASKEGQGSWASWPVVAAGAGLAVAAAAGLVLWRRSAAAARAQQEPPSEFLCPITKDLMERPVFTADGHTYELQAIREWLKRNNTSPKTGQQLPDKVLRPNHALRAQIADYREQNGLPPAPPWDGTQEIVESAASPPSAQQPYLVMQAMVAVLERSPTLYAQVENLLKIAGGRTTDAQTLVTGLYRDQRFATQVLGLIMSSSTLVHTFFKSMDQGALVQAPIARACHEGNAAAVEAMLGRGPDVERMANSVFAGDGRRLLHCAVWSRSEAIVRMLLSKQVDPNVTDNARSTPLHLACSLGERTIATLLLDAGADIEARAIAGTTPLHAACVEGHVALVEVLLRRKADLFAVREDGTNALHQAAYVGNLDVCKFLLGQPNAEGLLHSTDMSGAPALHTAASGGHVPTLEYLMSQGADANLKSSQAGDTAAFRAAYNGMLGAACFLLDHGSDINDTRRDGMTLLHVAAARDHLAMVKELVRRKADMSIQNAENFSPLHSAVWFGRIQSAMCLINAGAPTDSRSTNQSTPLHFACWQGCTQVATALMDKGADVFALTQDGDTSLHQAAFHNHIPCVMLLLERFSRKQMPAGHPRPVGVSPSTPQPTFVNAQKLDGSTALHLAAARGHLDTVDALLSYGADPNIAKCGGSKPIDLARQAQAANIVQRLAQAAAAADP